MPPLTSWESNPSKKLRTYGGSEGKERAAADQNAFKHGLAAIENRHQDGVTTDREDSIRAEILAGLIQDKGGEAQISTATRILAEVIAADAAWLVVFNQAIDHVISNNTKARQNPRVSRNWMVTKDRWSTR